MVKNCSVKGLHLVGSQMKAVDSSSIDVNSSAIVSWYFFPEEHIPLKRINGENSTLMENSTFMERARFKVSLLVKKLRSFLSDEEDNLFRLFIWSLFSCIQFEYLMKSDLQETNVRLWNVYYHQNWRSLRAEVFQKLMDAIDRIANQPKLSSLSEEVILEILTSTAFKRFNILRQRVKGRFYEI